jgi:hypothetical protein
MLTGDELVGLLGAASDDPRVVDALREFAIRWPPRLEEHEPPDEPDWYVWRPGSAKGFEFGFLDEAYLRARDPSKRGASRLVLNSVCFYGQHDGVRPYAGELPFGLSLSDSRAAVRAKLTGVEVEPRVHVRDVWDTAKHRIVVQHDVGTGALDNILVGLRLDPWPPLVEDPPPKIPTIDEVVAMFGQPWHSPEMRRLFFPLGLDACGPDVATRRYADLRVKRGVELYFFLDPARDDDNPIKDKGALFSSAKFYRARHEDARAWAGDLPSGLEFDIACPEIVRRVGRPPDVTRDGPLSGSVLWHLPSFTLHVFYDNVDNVIFCASLFQPGTWRDIG